MPFAFATKKSNGGAVGEKFQIGLKIMGLLLYFMMVKKMLLNHVVLGNYDAPGCACGCILMDGGFSDNLPVTPALAYNSVLPPSSRSSIYLVSGPQSTMVNMKALMGEGP